MASSKNLQMVFTLGNGKTLTYSLSDPKDNITRAEVETAMNNMIAKNVVLKDAAAASKIDSISVKTVDNVEL